MHDAGKVLVHNGRTELWGCNSQGTTGKEGSGAPKQPPQPSEALRKLRRKHPVRDIALRTWW